MKGEQYARVKYCGDCAQKETCGIESTHFRGKGEGLVCLNKQGTGVGGEEGVCVSCIIRSGKGILRWEIF